MSGFDGSQLTALESMLGGPVPPAYVAFMATFPPALSAKRYGGLTRRIAEHELYDDPAKVVEENLDARRVPVWGDESESEWVASHLLIGMDLSGDAIFIDTGAGPAIHRYLVETGEVIEVAPDLATYAAMLVSDDPTLRRS
jgi:hypothetical protein